MSNVIVFGAPAGGIACHCRKCKATRTVVSAPSEPGTLYTRVQEFVEAHKKCAIKPVKEKPKRVRVCLTKGTKHLSGPTWQEQKYKTYAMLFPNRGW